MIKFSLEEVNFDSEKSHFVKSKLYGQINTRDEKFNIR